LLSEPTALGAFFLMVVIPGFAGAIVGVVVTAISSVVNTPTRTSFIVNLALGAVGYIAGMFIGLMRLRQFPDDSNVIGGTSLLVAVITTGAHEIVRWRRNLRHL
jgi:hypothetical protein